MQTLSPARTPRLRLGRPRLACWIVAASLAMSFSEAQATITAGFAHSCALLAEGAVECWGLNDSGQVGDGTTVDRATPTAVTGLTDSAVSILAGGVHTCAQLASGSLSCWGDNSQGQLGNGTTIASATPTAVSGLGGLVQSFSVGQRHSCAVLVGGSVRCWGDNTSGQIGDGTTQDRLVPTEVSGLGAAVNSVSAGDGHTCAVTTGGAVLCWGDNLFGQGGDGSLTSNSVPTPVSGLSAGAVAVATGGLHTCALTTAGAVLCWGDNFFGQVGTAGLGDELTPVTVAGIGGPAQTITTGDSFSCALLVSGALRCWGDNFDGGLGDGSMIDRSTPAEVSGFSSGVVEVELGTFHGCARTDADLLYCWGDNFFGQLGVEATEISLVPIQVLEFNCVETLTTRPLSISLVPQITIGMLLALLGWHLARRRAKRV